MTWESTFLNVSFTLVEKQTWYFVQHMLLILFYYLVLIIFKLITLNLVVDTIHQVFVYKSKIF